MATDTLQVWDYVVIVLMLMISSSIGLYYRFTGGRQKTSEVSGSKYIKLSTHVEERTNMKQSWSVHETEINVSLYSRNTTQRIDQWVQLRWRSV